MKYPNAYNGVKKIFTAQILSIIASACVILAVVLAFLSGGSAMAGSETAAAASGIGTVLFFVASAVLMIIAYIINLVGLGRAGRDEELIRKAFWLAILALVISIVQGVLKSFAPAGIWDEVASIILTVCNIFVTVFVIQGISNLADKLMDWKVSNLGSKVLIILVIFYALTIIAQIITILFRNSAAAATISSIMNIIASILSIVEFIVYLVYLGKAKKMLAEN